MISYAQNFEDVSLNRVFAGRQDGFYIDVGAMDPIDGSVTKAFYDAGWRGINIEPDPRFHAKLVAERVRDVNLSDALGGSPETRPLYLFNDQGLSTLNEAFRDHFIEPGLSWTELPCNPTTPAALRRRFV